jgi:hypothetical protein
MKIQFALRGNGSDTAGYQDNSAFPAALLQLGQFLSQQANAAGIYADMLFN